MALLYKAYQSNIANKEGDKLYYPRLVKVGKVVDTQKLAEILSEKSTLTTGDVHNVIRNLMTTMRAQLLESKSVRLDGLGTFTMVAHANGKGVKTSAEVSSTQITRLQCRFTPEYTRPSGGSTTRALLDGVEYARWDKGDTAITDDDDNGGTSSSGNNTGGGDLEE